MEPSEVKSEVEITEYKRHIKSVSDIFSHEAWVVGTEEIVYSKLCLNTAG